MQQPIPSYPPQTLSTRLGFVTALSEGYLGLSTAMRSSALSIRCSSSAGSSMAMRPSAMRAQGSRFSVEISAALSAAPHSLRKRASSASSAPPRRSRSSSRSTMRRTLSATFAWNAVWAFSCGAALLLDEFGDGGDQFSCGGAFVEHQSFPCSKGIHCESSL